ncbi:MAG TPA: DUF459 domain-containing protein [Hyphomicrobiaceae bacterium]|nr:DUF459 domain-containing protein [Hyphomicrobiaceae bacterium]
MMRQSQESQDLSRRVVLAGIAGAGLLAERTTAAAEPRLTIAVVGDSLADGMWGGLYRMLQRDKRVLIVRGAKNSVGFAASDLTDMLDRAVAQGGKPDAFVMMIGANDRRSFFIDGRPKALFKAPRWIELYTERVGRFMDHAGRHKVPVVWLLLPIMRASDATADAELINDIIVKAAASRPHVRLMPTRSITADDRGVYQAYFKDLKGQVRLMRAGDGVHFTDPAYELMADRVLALLRAASPRFQIIGGA